MIAPFFLTADPLSNEALIQSYIGLPIALPTCIVKSFYLTSADVLALDVVRAHRVEDDVEFALSAVQAHELAAV